MKEDEGRAMLRREFKGLTDAQVVKLRKDFLGRGRQARCDAELSRRDHVREGRLEEGNDELQP